MSGRLQRTVAILRQAGRHPVAHDLQCALRRYAVRERGHRSLVLDFGLLELVNEMAIGHIKGVSTGAVFESRMGLNAAGVHRAKASSGL